MCGRGFGLPRVRKGAAPPPLRTPMRVRGEPRAPQTPQTAPCGAPGALTGGAGRGAAGRGPGGAGDPVFGARSPRRHPPASRGSGRRVPAPPGPGLRPLRHPRGGDRGRTRAPGGGTAGAALGGRGGGGVTPETLPELGVRGWVSPSNGGAGRPRPRRCPQTGAASWDPRQGGDPSTGGVGLRPPQSPHAGGLQWVPLTEVPPKLAVRPGTPEIGVTPPALGEGGLRVPPSNGGAGRDPSPAASPTRVRHGGAGLGPPQGAGAPPPSTRPPRDRPLPPVPVRARGIPRPLAVFTSIRQSAAR